MPDNLSGLSHVWNLNEKGKKFAEKIVELGQGNLYVVKDLENIDAIVLEDYYSI